MTVVNQERQEATGAAAAERHDPYAALRIPDFRLLLLGSFLSSIAAQMLSVAIGWQVYERTGSAFALGLTGLVQVIPAVVLALPVGQIVDRADRQRVLIGALLLLGLASAGLAVLSATTGPVSLIYACLFLVGVARAFQSPASASLLAQVVGEEQFASAATWQSSNMQASAILGPVLGGFGVALRDSATPVYVAAAAAAVAVALLLGRMGPRAVERVAEPLTAASLLAGLRFVWETKVILAAITLDMVAVLLGGATALLPIFAEDILSVGAVGLGWLRAAPAIGALLTAVILAHRPPFAHAGRTLLLVVAGFGAVTIVFGLSRSFPLSLVALAALGVLDNVSVVIRTTLVLTRTPDALRGRVNAVHYLFIGLSNQLGAFESGIAAALLGATAAVVAGGIGTLLVVPAIALIWPEVRRLGRIADRD